MIVASLILDFTGIECTYGNIPNIPQAPDPVNEQCGTWLNYNDEDYFDKAKCILLKSWLEKRLPDVSNEQLKSLYGKLLEFANRAIELGTGVVVEL